LLAANFPKELSAQDAGRAGAYLRAGAGVRPLGLGGAFVAVANDVTAGYWNPAGLGQLAEPQFAVMYSLLSLDRKYNYVAAAYPFAALGVVSVSWINYQVGKIEGRDRTGAITGEFSNGENAFLFSYGKTLSSSFALGGTVKLLRHDLAQRSASGIGYDLGVLFKPGEFLTLGASRQNLHAQLRWDDPAKTKEKFSPLTRLGAQIKPRPFVNLSVDYEMMAPGKNKFHAGGEFFLSRFAGLRAGNDGGAMAFGASFFAPASRHSLSLDYALSRDRIDESLTHQFALVFKFNHVSPPPIANGATTPAAVPPQPLPAEPERPQPAANPIAAVPPEIKIPAKTMAFVVQVIEVRPPFLIVGSENFEGLQTGLPLRIYQSMLGKETGRYYGAGQAKDVGPRFAIVQMNEAKQAEALHVGDKLLLKVEP
jgi:hypothetical protein